MCRWVQVPTLAHVTDRRTAPPLPLPPEHTAPGRAVAFFDLDKTLIARSSAYAFGRQFLHQGLITRRATAHLAIAQLLYLLRGQSSTTMDAEKDRLSALSAGWAVAQVRHIAAQTVKAVVAPAIYPEARTLIDLHQRAGHEVVIVSASVRDLVEPIATELGITRVICSEMEIRDGRYTGDVAFYCKGAEKARQMARLTAAEGFDLTRSFAYSDSATDVPMLSAVGHPVAVNPDAELKAIARQRGWEVRHFTYPKPLLLLGIRTVCRYALGVAVCAAVTGAGWVFYAGVASRRRPQ